MEQELVRLISAVLTRLAEQGVTGTALEKEWTAIQEADPDEVEFCVASARLGLEPYSEAEPYEQLIVQAADELRGNLLGDFYDAVDPALMGDALEWIRLARSDIRQAVRPGSDAVALRRELSPLQSPADNRAWEKGWSHARAVRRALGLRETAKFSLTPYIHCLDRGGPDRGLRAVGGAAEEYGPVAVMEPGLPTTARRFTLARALCRYLWEPEPLFLVTAAYTFRQKVERAFATELLAPAAGIAELLDVAPDAALPDDLEKIAARFQVSPIVIKHQLENQLLATA
ncbi:ImmA/IrrE family metallo-endopeptidase [Sphaerimonospora cavernae]|uniref:ImmA/IrrE family metallo-endopeptidase n=1 Tax=Sphaerimonospora cavernae TaxID=1740611 RepID=A0ABV6U7R0_9ACTN